MLDLALMLALGGDGLADGAMLRSEPALFGPVASGPLISRLVAALAGDERLAWTQMLAVAPSAARRLTRRLARPPKTPARPAAQAASPRSRNLEAGYIQ